jgi:TRAP transporter TAXI family solute receptor
MPLLLGWLLLASCDLEPETVTHVRVVSGPSGGAWYPLGDGIAQLLEDAIPGVEANNRAGSAETNVTELNLGNAEVAFTYSSSAYDSYTGRRSFGEPHANLRHFATLYPALLQTAVRRRSNIHSYADLASKGISPGQVGLTGTLLAEEVLAAYGLSFDSVKRQGGAVHHVDYADSGTLMKDGYIEAFMALADVPLSSLLELNFHPGIRLLGIEPEKMARILDANPALIRAAIPENAYEGLTADVPTVGVAASLVVHKDLPEELVYRMAKAFWERNEQLGEVSPEWKQLRLEDALLAAAIPVHPGAQRFYDEVGVSQRRD